MARIAAEETAKGFKQIQVKLGANWNNEADIARLRLVREAVPEGTLVYGDRNCWASRLDATRVGRAVAGLEIMLEQPCATLAECAAVRDATGLAMKINEIAHDTALLLQGWQLGCVDAAATPLSKIMNVCDLLGYVSLRLDAAAPTREGSYISPSQAPGLGVNPDPQALGAPVLEMTA